MALAALCSEAATIYVNGNKITGNTSIAVGGGTVTYDASSKVLNVSGVNFSRTGSNNNGIDNQDVSDLRINFTGTNYIEIANADVINCRAGTTINVESGTTTLKCTATDQNAIKARGGDVTITGTGFLKLISNNGAVIEGKNRTETCTMSIYDCTLEGGRNKFFNLYTLKITPMDKNTMFSTRIWMGKGSASGYCPVKQVNNLVFDTNVHVSAPANSTTEMLTYDDNYGSAFTVSDEHEFSSAETIGDFQYRSAMVNGVSVAKLLGPSVAYFKNHGASMLIPGYVRIGGGYRPVYIAENAFRYTDICQWLTLEYGVRGIGDYAFGYGSSLMSVHLPSSVMEIGNDVFYRSGGGVNVFNLYWSTLDLSAVSIGSRAFEGISNSTRSVYFPTESVRSSARLISDIYANIPLAADPAPTSCYDFMIGANYFIVNDHNNHTMALTGTTQTALTLAPTTRTEGGNTFVCTTVAPYAFSGNKTITSVNVNNSNLTTIGAYAFANMSGLKTVNIAGNGLTINRYSFYSSALEELKLTGVTRLDEGAFYNATKLKTVELPDGLTFMGPKLFMGCSALTSLTVRMLNPSRISYGTDIFTDVDKQACVLSVPAGKLNDYKSLWPWSLFYNIKEMSGLKGDVNGDNQVTVADVTALYNIILGLSNDYRDRADVNDDSQINVADVTVVYSIILGS